MRQRDLPDALKAQLIKVVRLPLGYTGYYLGRCKLKEGYLDIPDDNVSSNRKLRVAMNTITLRGAKRKRHNICLGWLPSEFGFKYYYWGLGRMR
jgi:hypothetical protein